MAANSGKKKNTLPKQNEKYFDAVQMVREIRDAIYKQRTSSDFDPEEFRLIKEKWTGLLKQQQKSVTKRLQRVY